MPFAETCGCITGRFKHLGSGDKLRIQTASPWWQGSKNFVTPGITSCQKGCPGGGTYGLRDVKLIETTAAGCETFHVWCGIVSLAKRSKIGPSRIVQKHYYDVGFPVQGITLLSEMQIINKNAIRIISPSFSIRWTKYRLSSIHPIPRRINKKVENDLGQNQSVQFVSILFPNPPRDSISLPRPFQNDPHYG
jgi:hypothetical protein